MIRRLAQRGSGSRGIGAAIVRRLAEDGADVAFSYSKSKERANQVYSRGWSRDLGSRGITVNVIQPGAINTDMNPENGAASGLLKGLTALSRYGQPEDIAAAV
jgi:NAD(P)-dependent dehydrogenase (short-subunit alcohol dehydrogenase family)